MHRRQRRPGRSGHRAPGRPCRRPVPAAVAVAVALLLAAGPGCSWIAARRPPEGPIDPREPLACTEDYAPAVLDTVGAAFFGLTGLITTAAGTAYAAGACPGCYGGSKVAPVALGVAALAGAALLGTSANHGYRTAEACQAAIDLRSTCLSGVEASCATLEKRAVPEEKRAPPRAANGVNP